GRAPCTSLPGRSIMRRRPGGRRIVMLGLLKDPLLHFLVLGGLLFAVSAWRGGEEEAPDRIVINELVVERVADAARRLYGREPTRDELREVLEPTIRDEIFYREALA